MKINAEPLSSDVCKERRNVYETCSVIHNHETDTTKI